MFGRAKFTVGTVKKLMIPATAILRKGSLDGVFVLDPNGTARFRAVKTGEAGPNGSVEVLAGLNPGDSIVTSEVDKLYDGQKVRVK
jgi:multidrug efflux pump subunit AcrA (membrane-fusion protein)